MYLIARFVINIKTSPKKSQLLFTKHAETEATWEREIHAQAVQCGQKKKKEKQQMADLEKCQLGETKQQYKSVSIDTTLFIC